MRAGRQALECRGACVNARGQLLGVGSSTTVGAVGLSVRFVLQAFLPSEPPHGTHTPPTFFIVLKLGLNTLPQDGLAA